MSEDKYCDTSKLYVKEITKSMAKSMVVKYHYSHLWTKCSVALGLFNDTGKEHSFFSGNTEELIHFLHHVKHKDCKIILQTFS